MLHLLLKTNNIILFPTKLDSGEVVLYLYWIEGNINKKTLIDFYQVYKHYECDVYFADKRDIWNMERVKGDLKVCRHKRITSLMRMLRIKD